MECLAPFDLALPATLAAMNSSSRSTLGFYAVDLRNASRTREPNAISSIGITGRQRQWPWTGGKLLNDSTRPRGRIALQRLLKNRDKLRARRRLKSCWNTVCLVRNPQHIQSNQRQRPTALEPTADGRPCHAAIGSQIAPLESYGFRRIGILPPRFDHGDDERVLKESK